MKKASKNVKPGNASGFISFSQVAASTNVATDESTKQGEVLPIYLGSHPELLVISKKIAKKNEVTRMKSLQELLDVLQTLDASYVPEFLPFFVHVYHRLAFDNKRAVREKLNVCLTQLFAIDKHAFQPHMTNLIGTLWMLRGDTYPEVADAARNAFETAIPKKKRIDVLAHLSRAIFQYMADKLSQSMEQLSDMSQCTVEEASERHERVTCSILVSLSQLIHFIGTSAQHLTTILPHATIVINDKLWKKLTSKRVSVRRCCYDLLSVVCQDALDMVIMCDVNRLSVIVFNALHAERDGANVDALCSMIVSFMNSQITSWNKTQWNKVLCGDLLQIFTTHSFAVHHLLPILSTVPTTILSTSLNSLLALVHRCNESALHVAEALTYAVIRCSKNSVLPTDVLSPCLSKLSQLLTSSMMATDNSNSIAALLSQLHRFRLQILDDDVAMTWDQHFWLLLSDTCPLSTTALQCIKESIVIAHRDASIVAKACGVVRVLEIVASRIFAADVSADALQNASLCCNVIDVCDDCISAVGPNEVSQSISAIRCCAVQAIPQNRNGWFKQLLSTSFATNDVQLREILAILSAAAVTESTISDLWLMCMQAESVSVAALLLHQGSLLHAADTAARQWLQNKCSMLCNGDIESSGATFHDNVWFVVGALKHKLLEGMPANLSVTYHYALLTCSLDTTNETLAASLAAAACDDISSNGSGKSGTDVLCCWSDVWSVYSSSSFVDAAAGIVFANLSQQLHEHQWSAQHWADVAIRLRNMTSKKSCFSSPLMSSDLWSKLAIDIVAGDDSAYETLAYIAHILFCLDAQCVAQQIDAFKVYFDILSDASLCLAVTSAVRAVDSDHNKYCTEIKDLLDLVHALLCAETSCDVKQALLIDMLDLVVCRKVDTNVSALQWLLTSILHASCHVADKVVLETPLVSDRCSGSDVMYVSIVDNVYSLFPAKCVAEHRQAGEAPYYSITISSDNSTRDLQTEAHRILLRWSETPTDSLETSAAFDALTRALISHLQDVENADHKIQEYICSFISALLGSKYVPDVDILVKQCIELSLRHFVTSSMLSSRLIAVLCTHSRGIGDGLWLTSIIAALPKVIDQLTAENASVFLCMLARMLQFVNSRQLVLCCVNMLQKLTVDIALANDTIAEEALSCVLHMQHFQKTSALPFSMSMDGDWLALLISFSAFKHVTTNNRIAYQSIAIEALDAVLQKSDRHSAMELLNMDTSMIDFTSLYRTMLCVNQAASVRVQCCKILDIVQGSVSYSGGELPVDDAGLDDTALATRHLEYILTHISSGGDVVADFNNILGASDWCQRDVGTVIDDHKGDNDTLGAILQWLLVLQTIDAVSRQSNACQSSLRAAVGSFYQRNAKWMEFMTYLLGILERGPEIDEPVSGSFSRLHAAKEDFITATSDGFLLLVAYALFRTVCCLPAAVRAWWCDNLPRASKNYVAKFVESHVINSIVKREAHSVRTGAEKQLWQNDELEVRCNVSSREVVSVYHRDEVSIEMVMCMPRQYPLKNIDIKCSNRMGIPESRWKRWTLQIIQLLSQQDGTILDALLLWKRNVDKEFEGVEPCPICYSILHPKTLSMPSLTCPTCKNKFHSTCLYTWFKTSGKNKCVLCQQPFFLSG